MKTNAIIRIILFSLAIVILVGILLAGIGLKMYSVDFSFRGDSDRAIQDGTISSQGNVPASQIRDIEIDWVAGSITIAADGNSDQISFCEYGNDDPDHQMVWKQEGDTLSIQYEKSKVYVGVQVGSPAKDLVITVPTGWECDSLELDAASAEVDVKDLTIREVDFDGASGICSFENCVVTELDMDTASGDITFSGEVTGVTVSAMSAACDLHLTNVPRQIDLDTMSGDLELTLPQDCGFTVSNDALSGEFVSDFETTSSNGHHVHGDGRCRINIDSMSGNVSIYKCTDSDHHSGSHHH